MMALTLTVGIVTIEMTEGGNHLAFAIIKSQQVNSGILGGSASSSASQGVGQPTNANTGASVSQGSSAGSLNNVNGQTQANSGNYAAGNVAGGFNDAVRCPLC